MTSETTSHCISGRATDDEALRFVERAVEMESLLMPDDKREMAVSLTNRVHLLRGDAGTTRQPLAQALEYQEAVAGPEDESLIGYWQRWAASS